VSAVARTAALGLWAAAMWWLWLSGEADRYVGPRTAWVVVFGAVALTLATALLATTVRRAGPPLAPREALGLGALLLPILAVLAVPEPDLGAQAAARKAAPGLAAPAPSADGGLPEGPLTVVDVDQANRSPEYARARGVRPGARVRMEGFVTLRDGIPHLTRFSMFCCAADALPSFARLDGIGRPPEDRWLRVEGTIATAGSRVGIRVLRAVPIEPPDDQYLE